MEQTLASPQLARPRRIAPPLVVEGTAVLLAVLAVPVAMYAANLAPFARLAYPALNFLLAGYLYVRRSPWFAAHCVLAFCCVSLVRRLVDDQAGFDPSNPVLLTPYLCCLYAGLGFLEYWLRPRPNFLAPFLVIMACIAYGTALALLDGRFLSSLVDVLKWSVGPLFAVYVLANQDRVREIRGLVEPVLIAAATGMALYGIVQFLEPAHWDITWVRGVRDLGFESVGQPVPFGLRVFATMNSPGSFGTILSAAIVLALKRRLPVFMVCLPAMIVGLALCQYRSLWAMTALAVLMVVFSPSRELRRVNVLAMVAVALLLSSTALAPQVREAVFTRAASLSELEGDESLRQRLMQYREFFSHDNLLVGDGLAINGVSRRLDNKEAGSIDGAIIEIYSAMGVFVGTAFMISIAVLIAGLFGRAATSNPHVWFDRAIVLSLFLQFPIGTVHIGELGFCAWMFLGLGLATRLAPPERA